MHHFGGVTAENYKTLTLGQVGDLLDFVEKLYKD